MLWRIVAATFVYNNTVDEPYHIGSAMVLWESKQLTVGVQHPPVVRWVIGLPLLLQGVHLPEARDNQVAVEFPAFGIGRQVLFGGQIPYWRMLTAARHALLIFPVIALFYVYRLGRYLADARAAMLATIFFSLDPTMLAHSALIGTDVAGCAGFLAGFYYGLRFIARPNWRRATIAGVALGLAIACKFSCLLLIPVLMILLIARWLFGRRRARWRWILLSGIVTFITIWATYGFAVNPMRQQAIFNDQPIWTRLPAIIREQPIPMPTFWLGQLVLANRAAGGHPTYLDGQVSFTGWRTYFIVAMLVKEPVGFLAAFAIGLCLFAWIHPARKKSLILLAPIATYFCFSLFSRYQLGVRHLLPILPLMYLFATMTLSPTVAATPASPLPESSIQGRRRRRSYIRLANQPALLLALIALTALETAAIHPDYLAYFNFPSGGPAHGDRWLIDSNLDWGQDQNRLATWLKSDQAQGRPYTIRCAYADESLLKVLGLNPAALTDQPHGLFAVSKNVEHRLESAVQDKNGFTPGEDYSWLSRYPIVKRIGYSIDVYDLDVKDSQPK